MPPRVSAFPEVLPRPDRRQLGPCRCSTGSRWPEPSTPTVWRCTTGSSPAWTPPTSTARRGHSHGRLRDADALLLAGLHQPRSGCPQAGGRARGGDDPRGTRGLAGRGRSAACSAASAIRRSSRRAGPGVGRGVHQRAAAGGPRARRSCWAWRTTTRTASGRYPEFAQKQDVFLDRSAMPSRNASISACSTTRPTPSSPATTRSRCCEAVADRVVSMHASDRYLAEGASLEELRQSRRHARLFAEPAPRRDRQGPERLRRHLPHPGGARLSRLGQHRGRHERHGRDGRVAGVPAADDREVLPRIETMNRKVRTALVGCGKVGQIHAAALRELAGGRIRRRLRRQLRAGARLRRPVRRARLHRSRRA